MLIPVAADTTLPRHERVVMARKYYDGQHPTQLTVRQREYLQMAANAPEFRDNYCPIVVDSLAERLTITGFLVEGDKEIMAANDELKDGTGEPAQTQSDTIQEWWARNKMDEKQGIQHLSAIRDADSYLIVDWSDEFNIPLFSTGMAWDGEQGVEVVYSSESKTVPLFAFKRWKIRGGERLNVYWPDKIEKYKILHKVAGGAIIAKGVRLFKSVIGSTITPEEVVAAEAGQWVLLDEKPWIAKDGKPLGVPVFHYLNRGQGYVYGQSELKDIIPIQNALNKAIIDLVAAADTTAFRIYTMVGDDPSNLDVYPGVWVYSDKTKDEVEIGHIPGEDLTALIQFKDAFAFEVARVSRTPLSFFQISRAVAAEGTLKQEEAGLVARAKNRQISFGNTWENAITFARRLAQTFGSEYEHMNEDMDISAIWADPETRNDEAQINIFGLKIEKLGVPADVVWSEIGYTLEQIKEMKLNPLYKQWKEGETFWQG
ncbi:MAG: phage portal protein, partial [Deltaproteobacteria bacterium]|nr:phage portal protein [Deltaproteobacteria bacterium]